MVGFYIIEEDRFYNVDAKVQKVYFTQTISLSGSQILPQENEHSRSYTDVHSLVTEDFPISYCLHTVMELMKYDHMIRSCKSSAFNIELALKCVRYKDCRSGRGILMKDNSIIPCSPGISVVASDLIDFFLQNKHLPTWFEKDMWLENYKQH